MNCTRRRYTYRSWINMKARCAGRYFQKGIKICPRWNLFNNFIKDMGLRPLGKTIDRINNAGNYEPDNCRWATPKQQAANRRFISKEERRAWVLKTPKSIRIQRSRKGGLNRNNWIKNNPIAFRRNIALAVKRSVAFFKRHPDIKYKNASAGGKVGGIVATHRRWHENRGKSSPKCKLCRRAGR